MTSLAYALKGWPDSTLVDPEQERLLPVVTPTEVTTPETTTERALRELLRELVFAAPSPTQTASESRRPLDPKWREQFEILLEMEEIVDTAVHEVDETVGLQEQESEAFWLVTDRLAAEYRSAREAVVDRLRKHGILDRIRDPAFMLFEGEGIEGPVFELPEGQALLDAGDFYSRVAHRDEEERDTS